MTLTRRLRAGAGVLRHPVLSMVQGRLLAPHPTARAASSTAHHLPLTTLSEDEAMLREAAARFAREHVAPRVDAMDESGEMDPSLIAQLFEAGFMGVEIDQTHGGSGSSFTAALLVVEAKVSHTHTHHFPHTCHTTPNSPEFAYASHVLIL